MRLLAVLVAGLAVLLLAGAAATYLIVRSIEARYPPAGRFVEVTGGRLHYIELGPGGKGPAATVLLLHGASGSSG
ncbi:MAG: alpha/beta hydrolase, partial [Microvirga sp.]